MDVRGGTLLNVYGRPARQGEYLLMPAYVHLDGRSSTLEYGLADLPDLHLPPVLRHPAEWGFDAAWVCARIPRVFGFAFEAVEDDKTFLWVGFVAATLDGATCYPFVATDHYGRTALMFGESGPEASVKEAIARSFWEALLRDPDDLDDLEVRAHHPDALNGVVYGCDSGRIFRDAAES